MASFSDILLFYCMAVSYESAYDRYHAVKQGMFIIMKMLAVLDYDMSD